MLRFFRMIVYYASVKHALSMAIVYTWFDISRTLWNLVMALHISVNMPENSATKRSARKGEWQSLFFLFPKGRSAIRMKAAWCARSTKYTTVNELFKGNFARRNSLTNRLIMLVINKGF